MNFIDNAEPPTVMLERTLQEHVAFVLRNLMPRSVFANVVALVWIVVVSWFVRWFIRVRAAAERAHAS